MPILTLFPWEHQDHALRHQNTPQAFSSYLRRPPGHMFHAIDDARTKEHQRIEELSVARNQDEAFNKVIQHHIEASTSLMEIAAAYARDPNSAESITNADVYFLGNEDVLEDSLRDTLTNAQYYRMAVNRDMYGKQAVMDPGVLDENINAEAQHENCNEAFYALEQYIGARQQEITNALNAQNTLKSMSPTATAMFEYANEFLDQAKIMASEWHGKMPPIPPKQMRDESKSPQPGGGS